MSVGNTSQFFDMKRHEGPEFVGFDVTRDGTRDQVAEDVLVGHPHMFRAVHISHL